MNFWIFISEFFTFWCSTKIIIFLPTLSTATALLPKGGRRRPLRSFDRDFRNPCGVKSKILVTADRLYFPILSQILHFLPGFFFAPMPCDKICMNSHRPQTPCDTGRSSFSWSQHDSLGRFFLVASQNIGKKFFRSPAKLTLGRLFFFGQQLNYGESKFSGRKLKH